jgi:hypothetical protein
MHKVPVFLCKSAQTEQGLLSEIARQLEQTVIFFFNSDNDLAKLSNFSGELLSK